MPNQPSPLRVLFLADSHLGFDLPTHPRVERRRRGHDFLSNYERALAHAGAGDADLVVHGGDVFHRSRVPPSLVYQAFRPLLEIADSGVPVFVVPGNHERSRIPHDRLATHSNLHIFRRPETKVISVRDMRVALSGFPYERRGIRDRFPSVLEETGWRYEDADVRLLCFHHCVEGATVGPADYTFRHNPDVIRCGDLPQAFAAVLSGHIHRHQVLREDLQGRPLPTPVLYPGSVERTAFAEMEEEKGFLILELEPRGPGGVLVNHHFNHLPARQMIVTDLCPDTGPNSEWLPQKLEAQIRAAISSAPRDAVLRVRVRGRPGPHPPGLMAAAALRRLTPPEMNIEVLLTEAGAEEIGGRRSGARGPTGLPALAKGLRAGNVDSSQLELNLPAP